MSVAVLSSETFVKLAATLQYQKEYGRISGIQYVLWNVDVEKFVDGLRQANARSFQEKNTEDVKLPEIKYCSTMPLNQFQLVKTMESIQYNIELDDYEGKDTLATLIFTVMKHIVRKLPEYEMAVWG